MYPGISSPPLGSSLIAQCYYLLAQGLSPSTHRVYTTGQRIYFEFCGSLGVTGFPSSEWLLMLFPTWLFFSRGLAPSSITTYLSAVRSLHLLYGFPDPLRGSDRLARLFRGIRRSYVAPTCGRLPINNRLLRLIRQALAIPAFDNIMFWAACCTAFFGFLRVSEFTCTGAFDPSTHLSLADVTVADDHFCLRLKSSKCDPFRKGCLVQLGRSGSDLCPVGALSQYLSIRGGSPGPLFQCLDRTPLSPVLVNKWLRLILHSAGITGNYSSHSFRIGAATSAALAGLPDHLIQTLGRWSSDAYLRYIRTPTHVLVSSAQFLV